MALSEFEQRKLDEIERALDRDDPGFAGAIKMGAMRRHGRFVGAVVFVVGCSHWSPGWSLRRVCRWSGWR